jgi:HPr kinase/phosphorylase
MSEGREDSLRVKDFYQKTKSIIELRPAIGRTGFSRRIDRSFSRDHSLQIQIWGKHEIKRIGSLPPKKRKNYIKERLGKVSCVILSEGLTIPETLERHAKEEKVALFVTGLSKKVCREKVKELFTVLKSIQTTFSGGLLKIFGIGLLIMGDSGVGKSESTLELISRGHRFVCDDVVQIRKNEMGRIVGSAVPLSRNFMEIRGLGIINIKKIYGAGSISPQANIDLVVELKRWKEGKEYDRLGLKFPESHDILGIAVPKIPIPVAPGRNIATLVEVACKVFLLKKKGYLAAEEISKKLDRALSIR